MKKYVMLLVLFLGLNTLRVDAQWTTASIPCDYGVKCFVSLGANLFAGTLGCGVYMSSDSGATWTPTTLDNQTIFTMAENGSNIFAGTYSGIFMSSDTGQTWNLLSTSFDSHITSLVTSGTDLYATTFMKIYMSADTGQTWNLVHCDVTNFNDINSLVVLGNELIMSTRDGLFTLSDTSSAWYYSSDGFPYNWTDSRALVSDGSVLYAGTQNGVYQSVDSGDFWLSLNFGLTDMDTMVNSLFLDGEYLISGTDGGVLVLHVSGRSSWVSLNENVIQSSIYSLNTYRNSIYAGTDSGKVYIRPLDDIVIISSPVLSGIGNMSVCPGELLQYQISATDANGDSLIYTVSNLPVGASFNSVSHEFSWTPSISQIGVHSNIHFVVSDGSLTDAEDISITVNVPPIVLAGTDTTICSGTSIALTGSGTAASYLWDGGVIDGMTFTPSQTNTYIVVGVDDEGCVNSDTILVSLSNPPVVVVSETSGTLYSSEISGNQWYEQTLGLLAGATSQSYTPTQSGQYYVVVNDSYCTVFSDVFYFIYTFENANALPAQIQVYPNPFTSTVTFIIRPEIEYSEIEIVNLLGQVILTVPYDERHSLTIDTNWLSKGIYAYRLIKDSRVIATGQLVAR